jgi:integrase
MSVYRRNDHWYYEFKINSTRYKKSIPTARLKVDAEQAESEARRQVHQGLYGKPVGDRVFFDFAKNDWIEWVEENHARPEQAKYMLKSFKEFFGRRKFNEITSFIVERYKNQLLKTPTKRGTPRNKKSVNRNLAALSRIFRLAIQKKVAGENPVKDVTRFPEGQGRVRYLTDDERVRILAALEDQLEYVQDFVLLAMNTGMRFSEINKLKAEEIDWSRREILLPAPKSQRPERVPINQKAAEILQRLSPKSGTGYLLLNPKTKKPYGSLKKSIRTLCQQAEIENFTFHSFRHDFATELVENNVNLAVIASILRHKDIKTTMKYAHAKDDSRHSAVRKIEETQNKVPNAYPADNVRVFKNALTR